MNSIRTMAAFAVLLAATGTPLSTTEARDPNSDKQTHYYSSPIPLLPHIDQLRICVADAAKKNPTTSYLKLQVKGAMHDINGVTLLETEPKSFEPGESGVCFDVATDNLGPPGGALPTAILAELIVSAPAESQAVPKVTYELRNSQSNTSSAVLIPAAQADAPAPPAQKKWLNSNFKLVLGDTLTHVIGPFTLAAGREIEICAADATKVSSDTFSINFTEIRWTAEVYEIGGNAPLLIVVEDVEGESLGVCFEDINLTDLALGGPDSTQPETLGLLILLYAEAPPGSQIVPMATGRLKPIIFDEPEPVPLLLPAVQQVRSSR